MSDPLLDRQVRRRLAVLRHVEEVTGNVAMTCRYFGISRRLLLRRAELRLVAAQRRIASAPATAGPWVMVEPAGDRYVVFDRGGGSP